LAEDGESFVSDQDGFVVAVEAAVVVTEPLVGSITHLRGCTMNPRPGFDPDTTSTVTPARWAASATGYRGCRDVGRVDYGGR